LEKFAARKNYRLISKGWIQVAALQAGRGRAAQGFQDLATPDVAPASGVAGAAAARHFAPTSRQVNASLTPSR